MNGQKARLRSFLRDGFGEVAHVISVLWAHLNLPSADMKVMFLLHFLQSVFKVKHEEVRKQREVLRLQTRSTILRLSAPSQGNTFV